MISVEQLITFLTTTVTHLMQCVGQMITQRPIVGCVHVYVYIYVVVVVVAVDHT